MQGGRPPETVDKTLSMVFRCKADGAALQRRRHHVPVREAHGRNMIAEASCRLAFRPSKDPLGEVWRAEALQIQSEPGDMCGGFGSLAQQGFPARFPGRAPGRRGNVFWWKRPAARCAYTGSGRNWWWTVSRLETTISTPTPLPSPWNSACGRSAASGRPSAVPANRIKISHGFFHGNWTGDIAT